MFKLLSGRQVCVCGFSSSGARELISKLNWESVLFICYCFFFCVRCTCPHQHWSNFNLFTMVTNKNFCTSTSTLSLLHFVFKKKEVWGDNPHNYTCWNHSFQSFSASLVDYRSSDKYASYEYNMHTIMKNFWMEIFSSHRWEFFQMAQLLVFTLIFFVIVYPILYEIGIDSTQKNKARIRFLFMSIAFNLYKRWFGTKKFANSNSFMIVGTHCSITV